jgi:hypothetical protein
MTLLRLPIILLFVATFITSFSFSRPVISKTNVLNAKKYDVNDPLSVSTSTPISVPNEEPNGVEKVTNYWPKVLDDPALYGEYIAEIYEDPEAHPIPLENDVGYDLVGGFYYD